MAKETVILSTCVPKSLAEKSQKYVEAHNFLTISGLIRHLLREAVE